MTPPVIVISKFDAGRRQLETAINLWFHNSDPVSVHTLACAAYEVIHYISKIRNPGRRDLLFDTALVNDQYRGRFAKHMKEPANFFKHSREDGEKTIEFKPRMTEGFILFSILGVQLAGERFNRAESAYLWWFEIMNPELLTQAGKEFIADRIPLETFDYLRRFPKTQFFDAFMKAPIPS